jgi:hypothetical protein
MLASVRMIWNKLVAAQKSEAIKPILLNFSADPCSLPSFSINRKANASKTPITVNEEKIRSDLFSLVKISDNKLIVPDKSFEHT